MKTSRIFVEKKPEYQVESNELLEEIKNYLGIKNAKNVRVIDVYDFYNTKDNEKDLVVENVLYDKQINKCYERVRFNKDEEFFRVKFLSSQYNQKEDIVNDLANKFLLDREIIIKHSQIISISGINKKELDIIKKYYINPIEKKEIKLTETIKPYIEKSDMDVEVIKGFKDFTTLEIEKMKNKYELGLDIDDLKLCREYYKKENKDPTITELKLIDTYWSDHCRHTTFMTKITEIVIEDGKYKKIFEEAIDNYLKSRENVYGKKAQTRNVTLMDLATINMKEQVKEGILTNKEVTDEVNACSIEIDVDIDGKDEKWLLMFKNETHNHPTEMEPFGGAATCLGGAIRDPLSGRSYVYQAMRITGSKDPNEKFERTLEGKLPQRYITQNAMKGYSSYANQIGSATGYVREYYDDGFVAKRLECGALVAAAPKENVLRAQAEPTDVVILVGGRTGKDGLGGAVGSSKGHTEDSLESSGSEVQKGNPLIERKILRLFRKKEVSSMIKICNDFGAGGVSVAIGELADGIDIFLDKVPLKYEGLNPTEIALSESQERMAVVVAKEDEERFLQEALKEDLEATTVGVIKEEKVLNMYYKDKEIVNIKRSFLDTNGAEKETKIKILQPKEEIKTDIEGSNFNDKLNNLMKDINIASQRNLVENFDNTVGKTSVIMPYGGKYRLTPAEGMVGRIPVLNGKTNTCSIMTHGYDPEVGKISPFHAGYYAVLESVAKVVSLGGDYKDIRLSFQEYFERLDNIKEKWGKPLAALLGAYEIQRNFNIAAIGGKDSMSGSFENIDVPPTLISFAVAPSKINKIITNEFKNTNSSVILLKSKLDDNFLIDLEDLKDKYEVVDKLNKEKLILAAHSVKKGGVARSVIEMSLGNKIGFEFNENIEFDLFKNYLGSIILEVKDIEKAKEILKDIEVITLGKTLENEVIKIQDEIVSLESLILSSEKPLKNIFKESKNYFENIEKDITYNNGSILQSSKKIEKVKVLIPILPGTHGEYSLKDEFVKEGCEVIEYVFKTNSKEEIEKSFIDLKNNIENVNIIALPDGEVYGNQPDGGGVLLDIILNNKIIKETMDKFLNEQDGLMIGVGNGFESLLRSGYIDGDFKIVENINNKFISQIVDVKVNSNLSPWLSLMQVGDEYSSALATRYGRVVITNNDSFNNKQVATQFANENLTGSELNIESLTSSSGRVIGCLTSIDRMDDDLYKNINVKSLSKIVKSGVNYFK